MRSPKRHRPRNRSRIIIDPHKLAGIIPMVSYVGSPEHKDSPSFAGQPRPRADATICDPSLAGSQAQLTGWLRQAVQAGNIGAPLEGDYPRYVWVRHDDTVYEARLVNQGKGEYKGYPLLPTEHPDWI